MEQDLTASPVFQPKPPVPEHLIMVSFVRLKSMNVFISTSSTVRAKQSKEHEVLPRETELTTRGV